LIALDVNVPFKVTNPPASEEELDSLRRVVGLDLPPAYLELLRQSNGAECGPNDEPGDSLRILPVGELKTYNDGYGIQQRLPELLAFASDGGDHAFCFQISPSISSDHWPIFRQPLGALFVGQALFVAANFGDWQAADFRYPIC